MPDAVVVTGASRGIGRAIALRLARAGYDVVAWARSEPDLRELEQAGEGRIRTTVVDVRSWESVSEAAARLRDVDTRLRALVVNAGMGVWNEVTALSAADWHTMVDTNLSGAFYTLTHVAPMLSDGDAQVIALVSDSAWFASPGRAGYCASKAGLEGLVESFRREARPAGIRVTGLYPSRVDTHFRDRQPGGRPEALQSDDVAALVEYVLSVPAHVEIRSMAFSSITSPFGPFPEVAPASREQSA